MLCYTTGEFRGQELKTGKNGNSYYIIYFEELNTGKSFNMMSTNPYDIIKGTECRINFDLTIGSTYTRVKITSIEEM